MSQIPLTPVESSQIAAIGHDPATNTLAIQFKSGAAPVYHYANFSADDFNAFMGAKSIGSHFSKHIKAAPDRFPYTRIEAEKAES